MQSPLTHHDAEINGVRLHLVTAGPQDGPLVILLHGFPEFWFGWRKQIDALVSQGYHVVAPDQRGYGLSEKPRAVSAYKIEMLARDVIGIIAWAEREKAFLVGHDWGAAVAWQTAILFPKKIEKLVILNVPHPDVMQANLKGSLQQLFRSWYIFFFQLPWLPETLLNLNQSRMLRRSLRSTSLPATFSDAELLEYEAMWQQPDALRSMLNWYRAGLRYGPPRISREKRQITLPTLIIWGAQDQFLRKEMATQSLAFCDQGRLELLEDATHWVQHEKPEEVNRFITEFFTR